MQTTLTTSVQYFYSDGDSDDYSYLNRYPIMRETAKLYWVHSRVYDWFRGGNTIYGHPPATEWNLFDGDVAKALRMEPRFCTIPKDRSKWSKWGDDSYYHRPSQTLFHTSYGDYWKAALEGRTTFVQSTPDCFRFFGFDHQPLREDFDCEYRAMAKQLHPDHGGDTKAFQAMQYQADLCLGFYA